MDKFFLKLRVGERIGLGFAVVGLLLGGVVWHYHETLRAVLDDYQQLQTVFEQRKSLALAIEVDMAAARDAEKNFLLRRRETFAAQFTEHVRALQGKVEALAAIDETSRHTAQELQPLLARYAQSFAALADAWRSMGLDENSGLQGAFRQKIHRLHALSAQYNVDRLYVILLQIRRGEKDLALRRETAYRDQVRTLVADLRRLTEGSGLRPEVRRQLLAELTTYARSFETYASSVLGSGSAGSGKGPFREAAHRLEAILATHHVPQLEASVLELRRREKDFLLRGDEGYATMVSDIARSIRRQVSESPLAANDKALLLDLLRDYQRSFLVLVSQHASIGLLSEEMDAAAARVAPLIQRNAELANQAMATRVTEVTAAAQAKERFDLLVAICAAALAVGFAVAITARVVRPVRQMAGLLDDLAYGTPTERVPVVAGSRDEINAMGVSLNALLDHRATFLAWWKASMDELAALRELEHASSAAAHDEATKELRAAAIAKVQQLNAIRGRILRHGQRLREAARTALEAGGKIDAEQAKAIEHSAQAIEMLLAALADERQPPAETV